MSLLNYDGSSFQLVFTDPNGIRRWPPLIVTKLPFIRKRIAIDSLRIGAVLTLMLIAAGTITGVWWFTVHGVTWFDVALVIGGMYAAGLGISLGYHRLFTHLAFKAKPWFAALLGILGASTMQGQIMTWCSVHRRHHHHSDTPDDPHSPASDGNGIRAAIAAFISSHVGWYVNGRFFTYVDYVRDLKRDPVVQFVDRWYWLWVALGWIVPGFVGLAWYGTMEGYWSGLLAGGPIRAFLHLNTTSFVNSVCHVAGKRSFNTKDNSHNNFFVNLLAMNGEGLHNNHHGIPWSAKFALRGGEIDTGYWVLKGVELIGGATEIRTPTRTQIELRRASLLQAADSEPPEMTLV